MLSTEKVHTAIAQYFAAMRGDNKVEEIVACFAADCISQDPVDAPMLKGQAEVRQFFETILALFATIELTEEFVSVHGNEAAVKWKGQGMGKNGCEVIFEGIDWFEVNAEGKIQVIRGYWNPAAMLAKLQSAEVMSSP
jgi:steroid delta-isomerase